MKNNRYWSTRKELTIVSMVVAVMTLTFMNWGWAKSLEERPMGHRGSPEKFFQQHADRLGLTDDTLEQIRAIANAAKSETGRLRQPIQEARTVMRELLMLESPDEALIMEQVEKIGVLHTALRKHRIKVLLQIRALLTPAQREKLRSIREEFSKERRGCEAERQALCPDLFGPERFECVQAHKDELSESCRARMEFRRGHRH